MIIYKAAFLMAFILQRVFYKLKQFRMFFKKCRPGYTIFIPTKSTMPPSKPHPQFNKRIFWDVRVETLDIDSKAVFVIERVFERGDVSDIRECRRYYTKETIETALLNAKFLPLHTLYLAAAVTERNIEEFRCYKLRQSNQAHLPY
jgi:hypothetical protein